MLPVPNRSPHRTVSPTTEKVKMRPGAPPPVRHRIYHLRPEDEQLQPPTEQRARRFFGESHLAPVHTVLGSTVFVVIVTGNRYTRLCEWFDAGATASAVYSFARHQCTERDLQPSFEMFLTRPGVRPHKDYKKLRAAAREKTEDKLHTIGGTENPWLNRGESLHRQAPEGGPRMVLLLIRHEPDNRPRVDRPPLAQSALGVQRKPIVN
jgi:hypothetical protein